MSIFEAIILGIVQGLTEFLPISSSGHLLIVPAIMGWEDPGAPFTAVIQLGTMAAVLIYFRKDIWEITSAFLRSLVGRGRAGRRARTRAWAGTSAWARCRSSSSALLFSDQIESGARNLYLVGTMLIVFGLVLAAADIFAKHVRKLESIKAPDAVVDRIRPVAGADPGRLALGRDDHLRALPRLHAPRRRALLVPALDPGRRAQRRLRDEGRRRASRPARAPPR